MSVDEARWQAHAWNLVPQTERTPLLNMALDEVLTLRVGRGERDATLRIWGWSGRCVVLGRFQSVRNEVNESAASRHGVEIVRRISGGGAMFIEPEGAITWSISAISGGIGEGAPRGAEARVQRPRPNKQQADNLVFMEATPTSSLYAPYTARLVNCPAIHTPTFLLCHFSNRSMIPAGIALGQSTGRPSSFFIAATNLSWPNG